MYSQLYVLIILFRGANVQLFPFYQKSFLVLFHKRIIFNLNDLYFDLFITQNYIVLTPA